MLRTIPHAQRELRRLLASPGRPTWLAGWEPDTAYELDAATTPPPASSPSAPNRVATVCAHAVLLRDGSLRPTATASGGCG